jgi:hypothetical protein
MNGVLFAISDKRKNIILFWDDFQNVGGRD